MATGPRADTPIDEYFVFVRRVLHNLGERVGSTDIEALRNMVALRDDLDRAIEQAIRGLRHDAEMPASWADIGKALGTHRANAQKRYGHVGGVRQFGGQPGHWR